LPDALQRIINSQKGADFGARVASSFAEQPLINRLRLGFQADNYPVLGKQFVVSLVNYGSPADSYDDLPLPASSANRLTFQLSEPALSFLAKDLGNRFASSFDYLVVCIQETPSQSTGYLSAHEGLAGGRETCYHQISC
jgi:hypothetical protein